MATKAVFLGYGIYLTWCIRNIPSNFNESKYIALSLLVISTIAVISMAVVYLGSMTDVAVIFVESFSVLFAVLVTVHHLTPPLFPLFRYHIVLLYQVGLLIIPKIRAHYIDSSTASARVYLSS
jgi:hypothetical protein